MTTVPARRTTTPSGVPSVEIAGSVIPLSAPQRAGARPVALVDPVITLAIQPETLLCDTPLAMRKFRFLNAGWTEPVAGRNGSGLMEFFRLDGKTAPVTGGSRGIGRAIALRMAEAGANVVVSSRAEEDCAAVAAEIEAAGGRAIAAPCNVSRLGALPGLVQAARDAFGRIDILVGNAAANPYYGPLTGIEERGARQDPRHQSQGQPVALQGGAAGDGRAPRRCGDPDRQHRRLARHRRYRCLRPVEGGARIDGPQPRGALGPAQHPGQLHRPGAGANRFRPGDLGEPGEAGRRRGGLSAASDRRAGRHRRGAVWLAGPGGAFVTGQTIVVDGDVTIAGAREYKERKP